MRTIHLLVILLIALVFDGVTGMAATTAPVVLPLAPQRGVTPLTVPIGSSTASVIVNFSPVFAVAPDFVWGSSVTGNILTASGSDYSLLALGSTGQTWTSMPAVQTEIFGDVGQHQHTADLSLSVSVVFHVTCPLASNTAGAFLKPQYSIDTGVTWNDLASVAGGLNLIIDGTEGVGLQHGACGGEAAQILGGIAAAAKTNPVWLKVVGSGGGGVGDNPNFTVISITATTGTIGCSPSIVLLATKVTFTATCIANVATAVTFSFRWEATVHGQP